jgi:hypothetical protein
MPFVFVKEPVVWWPVKVQVPTDGGASADQAFEARFRVVSSTDFQTVFSRGVAALLMEVVVGWKGVKQADGNDLEFSPATLAMLIDVPFIATALADAYAELLAGGARKN